MQDYDFDLQSIQAVRDLARKGKIAANQLAHYDEERIDRIHGAAKQCWVMSGTQNRPGYTDPASLLHWRGMGVDGVLINEIEPLAGWLCGK